MTKQEYSNFSGIKGN